MNEEKKDCAFQYAYNPRWIEVKIVEDTGLITLSEAKALYEKYLRDFIRRLEDDDRPEMVIWIDMKEAGDYRNSLIWLDSSMKTDGVRLWKEGKREYLELK